MAGSSTNRTGDRCHFTFTRKRRILLEPVVRWEKTRVSCKSAGTQNVISHVEQKLMRALFGTGLNRANDYMREREPNEKKKNRQVRILSREVEEQDSPLRGASTPSTVRGKVNT